MSAEGSKRRAPSSSVRPSPSKRTAMRSTTPKKGGLDRFLHPSSPATTWTITSEGPFPEDKKDADSPSHLKNVPAVALLRNTSLAPPTATEAPLVMQPTAYSTSPSTNTAQSDASASPVPELPVIVQRKYYPPELSSARCEQYNSGTLPRPISLLESTITRTAPARTSIPLGSTVIHWFKRDLRTFDNRALHLAAEKAKQGGVPLLCLFIVSSQDYEAHLTSSVHVDFELRTLSVLKEILSELDIPLHVETVEKRKRIPGRIIELAEEWGARHIFCNLEYEIDELRREELLVRMCLEKGVSFTAVHDDVIVPPGALLSGQGKCYSVYSPWYRAWLAHIHSSPSILNAYPTPNRNPPFTCQTFAHIFSSPNPIPPPNKTLTPSETKRFHALWPPGEYEALDRLSRFLSEKIATYKTTRNFPGLNATSILSPHLSTGALSARTAIRLAVSTNTSSTDRRLDTGNPSITHWIAELAWRDFYKYVLCWYPYVCMNKPFKHEFSALDWDHNPALFEKWKNGTTGYPIIDAAMRQLKDTGYMHNRLRMLVASFLAKDLLLDWRLGEAHFMLSLIDGDFASNNGGWGFSASVGVDPMPAVRIFNPIVQSEKFDGEGVFIRRWVEELRNVEGKAVHDPYGRGDEKVRREVGVRGYPRMCVDHGERRAEALRRYGKMGNTGRGRVVKS